MLCTLWCTADVLCVVPWPSFSSQESELSLLSFISSQSSPQAFAVCSNIGKSKLALTPLALLCENVRVTVATCGLR